MLCDSMAVCSHSFPECILNALNVPPRLTAGQSASGSMPESSHGCSWEATPQLPLLGSTETVSGIWNPTMASTVRKRWLGLILTKQATSSPQGHGGVTGAMASNFLQGLWLAQSSI